MKHRPRKRFGQNFLQDKRVIANILGALNLQKKDKMVEIGPGQGALTLPLLKTLDFLIAIEIDRDLLAYLDSIPTEGKLKLIGADALTIDYSQWGKQLRIVGNLPYNISTPLLLRLIGFSSYIEDMHFMLQKEVVDRIAASPGTKSYGRLTVMVQYHCAVEEILDVPASAFTPQPKVDSAVIRIMPYTVSPYPIVAVNAFERLVAQAFSMRRKTLFNNLKSILNKTQLLDLGIDPIARPEQISVMDYARITKYISN